MKDQLQNQLTQVVQELVGEHIDVHLEHPADEEHGDYSSNIAMAILSSSKFKVQSSKSSSPVELAEEIRVRLLGNSEIQKLVERIDVAPPGFLNFWISKEELSRQLTLALSKGERYGESKEGNGKVIVVDYSSPNIAKRFGIGHLRSTIIGQTIYNLYQKIGYRVIGDNHIGDWGTQFGAIIAQVQRAKFKIQNLAELTVDLLEKLYVDFNRKAHENPQLWDEARMWFKKLEDGDKEAREIWEACVKVSMEEFDRIYELLGVHIDNVYGESFYQDKMGAVVDELASQGLVVEDQGALVIKYPNDEFVPGIIRKTDGATTYLTRDLATIKFRLEKWKPEKIIYEVGAEQSLHFQQLFKAVEMLGWTKKDRFVHVKHGLYLNPDGKKFSTRKGDTVNLEEVLLEAIERAKRLGKNDGGNRGDMGNEVTGNEEVEVARAVGIGAVKYFDLSHHPESQIVFSWEKMFLLTGNSGPYLQYTFARCKSVLQKSEARSNKSKTNSKRLKFENSNLDIVSDFEFRISDLQREELALLRIFYKFPEVITSAAHAFSPNLLANFLFDLASKYNVLYNNVRILEAGGETGEIRLALTAVVAQILKTGLELLGIKAPERM